MRIRTIGVVTASIVVASAAALEFVAPGLPRGASAPDRTIEIGIETTRKVPSADAVRTGAEFAIARAGAVMGFHIKAVTYDDSGMGFYDEGVGAINGDAMVERGRLLGIVGPAFSPVAVSLIPIANKAHLAIISPTTSVPCLTVPGDFCPDAWSYAALRPTGKNNFFRIAAAEPFRGAAMADFAVRALQLRRVAVWSDHMPEWGMAEADAFSSEFSRDGGLVVAREDFDRTSESPDGDVPTFLSDYRNWLIHARSSGAQAVYSGAWVDCGLLDQASQGIFDHTTFYLGGDAGPDPTAYGGGSPQGQCVADWSAVAAGRVYASSDIADASLNRSAAGTIAAYRKAHPGYQYDPNTFAGYDAAAILIAAIRRAIDANHGGRPTRQQVVDQLSSTRDFAGVTGVYSFNPAGDPTSPTVAILQYVNGSWVATRNVTTDY
jgi:branched-chain amino acid transport system substrate-binding protein